MGTKNLSSSSSDPKKRRRTGSSKIDSGVEANECISIYLVSKQEEVGSTSSFRLEPIDLNHFFEDGRIFGYQDLKITIWVNALSFHAYADISYESESDGGKGITDLRSALKSIFADNLIEEKPMFLDTFSSKGLYIKSIVSNAELLQHETSNEHQAVSNTEVYCIAGEPLGFLYCRLVPLVLLLVDGSNPIDITDPRWEMYVLVEKSSNPQVEEEDHLQLVGFAAVYRFLRYPDGARLRIGQILVLPQYQHQGYGRSLMKVLNNVAAHENVYDLTIEEPEDNLQHVRTCIDIERLLSFDPIRSALDSDVLRMKQESVGEHVCRFCPPANIIEDVRKTLKINKKQLLQCWEILIYLKLDPIEKYMEGYRAMIADKVKADVGKDPQVGGKKVVDVPTEYDEDTSFVMFKSQGGATCSKEKDEKQDDNLEEQLQQLVDERMDQIKLVVSVLG